MSKNDKYICGVCNEFDYGKAPHCKCEREYEREMKAILAEKKVANLDRKTKSKISTQ